MGAHSQAHDTSGRLRGEPFTDPSMTQQMPPGWEQRPVTHDPEVGEADLVVTLDQHLYPAILDDIMEFAAKEGIKVIVEEGTCGISAGKLAAKTVDIGGFCCPPGKTDRLPGLRFHTIGVEPIALIVHPGNPITGITIEQARRIFQGKVYRWSEITGSGGHRGKDLTIQTLGRLHCKLRPGHWRLLLDNEDLFSTRLTEVGTIPDMISLVAANPGAIGYEAVQMVRGYRDRGSVKMLKIDGFDPGVPAHLRSGDYRLYRTLNVTTWEGPGMENPLALKLVSHLIQKAGKRDGRFGMVPASDLRRAGWKFKGDELVGEPENK